MTDKYITGYVPTLAVICPLIYVR